MEGNGVPGSAALIADPLSFTISLAALGVSLGAAWFAGKSLYLKSGHRVRGSFTLVTTLDCEDRYVSEVTLANLKDRAVVIFKIFLEVDHGYFIELDDFESDPLILKPFEAIRRNYDPVDHYSAGICRISMSRLLGTKGVRRRLILSTPDGRYSVREWIRHWDPVNDFFRNYLTGIVRPMRSVFRGKGYGSNVKYLVQLTMPDGSEEVIPLRRDDHRLRVFRRFRLSSEALQSSAALEEFLLERAIAGDLTCSDLAVHDLESWRNEVFDKSGRISPRTASKRSWATYNILGPGYTWWSNVRTRRGNRRRQAERLSKARAGKSAATGC